MKILYVVTRTTQDELAIVRALKSRGHQVLKLHDCYLDVKKSHEFDLLLYNHSKRFELLNEIKIPKVCWCFDMITHPTFHSESFRLFREQWGEMILAHSDLAFFTDGDFVQQSQKQGFLVHWLQQAAHHGGVPSKNESEKQIDILLAATIMEKSRRLFAMELQERFSDKEVKVISGNDRVFYGGLSELISNSRIVIAPDTPLKPNYASDRIWIVLGYQGFLIHPEIHFLKSFVEDREGVVYYTSRKHLYRLISEYLPLAKEREQIAQKGNTIALSNHTYQHRVDEMLSVINQNLGL